MSLRRALALACLLAAAGCAQDFHARYAARHPGFDPARFPHRDADLEETLAALLAPRTDPDDRTTRTGLRIHAIRGDDWPTLTLEDVAEGRHREAGTRDYLVALRASCAMTDAQYRYANDAATWYLLVDDRLAAFRRARFDRRCQGGAPRVRYRRVPGPYTRCLDTLARDGVVVSEDGTRRAGCGPVPALPDR